jgi:hypothetical protein
LGNNDARCLFPSTMGLDWPTLSNAKEGSQKSH